ncbi:MAG: hypothetical protein GXX98_01535 [Planctomycetes bacterium]|nr:hypothetical protein [Planctomycetota bacterium]
MAKNGVTFIRIPVHLLALGLRSAHELALVGLAVGFNGKGVRMSNSELARLLQMDRRHVPRLVGRLVGQKYLRIETRDGRRIIHPTDTILVPPPDTNLVTKWHQSGDEVTPDLPCPSITEVTEGTEKRRARRTTKAQDAQVAVVFEHWNTYAGRSVEKPDGKGGTKGVRWQGHRQLSKDKRIAIQQALRDYRPEDIQAAIDNYATILLGPEYFWTYAWPLTDFLTRGDERHKGAPRKWWQFLPDNFDANRYRRRDAAEPATVGAALGCGPCDEAEGIRMLQEAGLWRGEQ